MADDSFVPFQEQQQYQQGLDQALQNFVGSVRSYQLTQALTQANQQVQQIKMSGIAEAKQREALGNVAQSLVLSMQGLGANPTQIEQAYQTLAPKRETIQSVEQGLFSQDPETRKRAEAAQRAAYQQQLNLKAMDMMKAGKAQDAELKQADKDFLSNTRAALNNLDQLEKVVERFGNYEGGSVAALASNKKASARLSQLFYDTAVAYAKIIDPTSVARESEVWAAQQYAVPAGLTVSNETTLEAIDLMRKQIKDRVAGRTSMAAPAQRESFGAAGGGSAAQQPAAQPIPGLRIK